MKDTLEKEIEFGKMFSEYLLSPPEIDMAYHWDVEIPFSSWTAGLDWLEDAMTGKDPRKTIQTIDVSIQGGVRVDVKAQPKGHQSHSYRWVELQNVNGDTGWLYGEADFIAFEYDRYWILVPRTRLVRLCEDRLDPLPMAGRDWSANPQPFKLHRRDGRKDVVTMVPVVDLCWIGTIIQKP